MKVIDLLNKIANGEKVPKKIKYDNKEFEFIFGAYEDKNRKDLTDYDYSCYAFLNKKVEIIEDEDNEKVEIIEEKKIPDKIWFDIGDKTYMSNIYDDEYECNEYEFKDLSNMFRQKINEIIDYLKSKGE